MNRIPQKYYELLFTFVQDHPLLYDGRDPDYKKMTLKDKLFGDFADKHGLKGSDVKACWRAFNAYFTKYLNESKAKLMKSGEEGTQQYESGWAYFETLRFLIPTKEQRVTTTNFPIERDGSVSPQPSQSVTNEERKCPQCDDLDCTYFLDVDEQASQYSSAASNCDNSDMQREPPLLSPPHAQPPRSTSAPSLYGMKKKRDSIVPPPTKKSRKEEGKDNLQEQLLCLNDIASNFKSCSQTEDVVMGADEAYGAFLVAKMKLMKNADKRRLQKVISDEIFKIEEEIGTQHCFGNCLQNLCGFMGSTVSHLCTISYNRSRLETNC